MTDPTALLGTWTLTREVDDRLAGERREVRGTASLALETPDRVRWSEEGVMTWAGPRGEHRVPVSRTLFVVRTDGAWDVHFEDGRLFHPWAVGAWVDHPCAPDHYRGLIEVGDAGWTVEWQARGPEKDYAMRTAHIHAGES